MRSVKGALPIALRAKAEGKIGLLVPKDNAAEAAVVKGLQVIPIQNLREAVGFLEGEVKISPTRVDQVIHMRVSFHLKFIFGVRSF